MDTVTVRAHPRVRLLITGDEIVTHGTPPHGKVRDAIGPALTGLLATWGVADVRLRHVPDQPVEALVDAIGETLADTDVTIVCGSTSVGPADGLRRALRTIDAAVHVDGVACRPGAPANPRPS
ncbi:molybdopterin-binding protein [Dactylosporangium sp. NPDC048998]|uniref:molybdopterin-binding protein n=1 Tax=Dactylosporangium sp. NPDC048998 TaxID=3363976 RepID=UPI00371D9EB1